MRRILAAAAVLALSGAAHAAEPLVSTEWLASNAGEEDLRVLDVRSGKDAVKAFEVAHIPGSVHSPYPGIWRTTRDDVPGVLPEIASLEEGIGLLGIDNDDHVVIAPEGLNASEFGAAARIYWTFKHLGHDEVSILDGGWTAWKGEGRPVESGGVSPRPAEFTADVRPDTLVTTEDLKSGEVAEGAVLVDARPDAQFTGKEKHAASTRFGRIPGALQLDQSTLYDAETNRLKDKDALAALMPTDLPEGAPVVSYCNTGHWAATNWFVLSEVLGREDVKLYDESMVGYSRDEALPIANERTRLDDLKDWWNGRS